MELALIEDVEVVALFIQSSTLGKSSLVTRSVARGKEVLSRVPEPEIMDSQEEAIAYDDMDHTLVNGRFVDDLLAAMESSNNGSTDVEVLDLGTGTARIPIMLCDATEDLRVFAVDLSVAMLDIARLNIELSPWLERIMLGRCDAKELDLEDNRFDVVMSNSIIHHVPDPQTTFSEAVRVCRSGGLLFFRDLLRPESEHAVHELVETYAGKEAEHARKMFDDSLRSAFSIAEIQNIVNQHGFNADSVSQTTDRHWTWCTRKP